LKHDSSESAIAGSGFVSLFGVGGLHDHEPVTPVSLKSGFALKLLSTPVFGLKTACWFVITSKLNAPRLASSAVLFLSTTATSALVVPLANVQSWSIATVAGLQSRYSSKSVCVTAPFARCARNALGSATANASSTPALSAPIQTFCLLTVTSNPSPSSLESAAYIRVP
jgi:hypothetical protein